MDKVTLSLEKTDVDFLLDLLNRKIEKAETKEIDEVMVAYLKDLKNLKAEIESQIL